MLVRALVHACLLNSQLLSQAFNSLFFNARVDIQGAVRTCFAISYDVADDTMNLLFIGFVEEGTLRKVMWRDG